MFNTLKKYIQHDRKRFHVPGHAGSFLGHSETDPFKEIYPYDLTELDGLDVLSEPTGILKEAQQKAAETFHVRDSFFLVNGATVGLIAAMLCCLKPGEKVILPRNVHRSLMSGLILTGSQPVWVLPSSHYLENWGIWGETSLHSIEQAFMIHPDARAVVITSPTYEGIGSDIERIAAFCKKHNLMLIVDEAHGSLWSFSDRLPVSAVNYHCDVVVQSLHKSGGSLTQSALAHLPVGSKVSPAVFQQALNTLQTTSPSYLLLSSLDSNIAFLRQPEGQERLESVLDCTAHFRQQVYDTLSHFQLMTLTGEASRYWDFCKLVFRLPGGCAMSWTEFFEQEQGISYESVNNRSGLYLANLGLIQEDFSAFLLALSRLEKDGMITRFRTSDFSELNKLETVPRFLLPDMQLLPRDAFFADGEHIPPTQAVGRIAKETVVHCPPGIPVLLPGEMILSTHLPFLQTETVMVVR